MFTFSCIFLVGVVFFHCIVSVIFALPQGVISFGKPMLQVRPNFYFLNNEGEFLNGAGIYRYETISLYNVSTVGIPI